MYIQVINPNQTKHNQFRTTQEQIVSECKKRGWKTSECQFKQIREELVDTKYRGIDGKTKNPTRQYKIRDKSTSNLNAPKRYPAVAV